ncbi:hypothetical protein E3U55_00625 [Filobacillus milosensis]|uniref:RNA-binding protein AU-1/Ribonuclease E/G domain-containing protein n=1 Tax=Filobacillus milosensis TaxID=94137 RepID=A0A4Y8ISL0_9BACI|nr:ribonuclease E/G [Filobacillus milosensis]TFB24928.1 hypothetical protein E3U55_00625 [Filobacillus milosensis]
MKQIYVQSRTKKQLAVYMNNNNLEDIFIQDRDEFNIGDVFLGIVKDVDFRLNVAFVRLNNRDIGFLKLEEPNQVHQGERVLVQIEKLATKSKYVTVNLSIQLQSPYIVILPYEKGIHTSKKLKEEERERLISLVNHQPVGLIIRTQSNELSDNIFLSHLKEQLTIWENIQWALNHVKSPQKVYQSMSDWTAFFNKHLGEINEMICDDIKFKEQLVKTCGSNTVNISYDLQFIKNRPYNLNQLVSLLTKREVPLSSGGHIIIDRTEAMTVIDVDTSNTRMNNNKDQILEQTNLKAAVECERQIRLRQLSGMILIDFINMNSKISKKKIIDQLRESFKNDSSITIYGFTKLGIVEMTRKRLFPDVYDQFSIYYAQSANQCELIMNQIEEKLLEYQSAQTDQLHLKVATKYNINWKAYLLELKERHELNFSLKLSEDPSLQEPFSLYKIEDGNRVNKQLRQQGIKVDNLF